MNHAIRYQRPGIRRAGRPAVASRWIGRAALVLAATFTRTPAFAQLRVDHYPGADASWAIRDFQRAEQRRRERARRNLQWIRQKHFESQYRRDSRRAHVRHK